MKLAVTGVGAMVEGGFLYYLFKNKDDGKDTTKHHKYEDPKPTKNIYDFKVVTNNNVN